MQLWVLAIPRNDADNSTEVVIGPFATVEAAVDYAVTCGPPWAADRKFADDVLVRELVDPDKFETVIVEEG